MATGGIDSTGRSTLRNGYQNELREQFLGGPSFSQVTAPTITAGTVGDPRDPRSVNAAAGDAGLQTAMSRLGNIGPGGIQQTLEQQAANELARGRNLSAEDTRNAQQAAREGWAARGLVNSKGAVAEEVLNRDALGRQREAERRQFAQGVDQAGFNQRVAGFGSALGLSDASRGYAGLGLQAQMANQGADLSLNDQRFKSGLANAQLGLQGQGMNAANSIEAQRLNQATGLAAQGMNQQLGMNLGDMERMQDQQAFQNLMASTQLRMAPQFDIESGILGQNSVNAGTTTGMMSGGGAMSSGGFGNQAVMQQFNPFNPYASDLYNTNYNAVEGARMNAANVSAGKRAGWMSLAGDIIGGLLPFGKK